MLLPEMFPFQCKNPRSNPTPGRISSLPFPSPGRKHSNFLCSPLSPHHAISTYLHPKFFYVFTRNLGSTPMQLQILEHWTSTPHVLNTRNLGSTPMQLQTLEHWTSTPHVLNTHALSRVSPARLSTSLFTQIFLSSRVALQIILPLTPLLVPVLGDPQNTANLLQTLSLSLQIFLGNPSR